MNIRASAKDEQAAFLGDRPRELAAPPPTRRHELVRPAPLHLVVV